MPSVASVGAGVLARGGGRRRRPGFCGGSTLAGSAAPGFCESTGSGKAAGPVPALAGIRRARAAGPRRRNASRYYKTGVTPTAPADLLPGAEHARRLAARRPSRPRRARIAEHRQGRRRSLRRGAGAPPRGARRGTVAPARRRRARRPPARRVRAADAAGPAARPLRHGLAGRPARAHAASRGGRAAARSGHLRHEGRHRAWRCSRCARCRSCDRHVRRASSMLWTTDEEIGSATSRATIEAERPRARRCSCSSRRCRAAR